MRRSTLACLLILLASAALTAAAMRRTSTTFDEILLPSAGARGYVTGKFDLVLDHPPLMQYVYGLPVFLSRPKYPSEQAKWTYFQRYLYARAFFWQVGNDAERIAFISRLMGVLMAAGLGLLTFLFTRRYYGGRAAVLAALLVAFLPDVLAHGGIAYNDVPLALAYFAAAWACDAAVRRPTWARVAAAVVAGTIAVGVKFSAVAIGPVLLLLLLAQAFAQPLDRAWLRRIALAIPAAAIIAYVVLVLIYLGDPTLADFRAGFLFNVRHANYGHGNAAVLLGRMSVTGFWYYFPLAFLLKTPAALHLLALIALLGFVVTRRADVTRSARLRALLASRLRVPVIASIVFLAFVMSAKLNIGFRHALPVLPGICILVAVGAARAWDAYGQRVRAGIGALALAYVVSSAAAYPNFLGYLSEYVSGTERPYMVLVDSSYDWGQGLLALRDFLREHQADRVFLSYFGSALPEGYGIDYVTLPSFFRLPPRGLAPGEPVPRYVAISATNMAGNYLPGDPLARFRERPPTAVLLDNIYVFELSDVPASGAPPAADPPAGKTP